jgi:hypothetical protein
MTAASVLDQNLLPSLLLIRYEKELLGTQWSSVRKGAVFGSFVGWNYFIVYIIYIVGFNAGSFLMHNDKSGRLNTGDVIVVRKLFLIHYKAHSYFMKVVVLFGQGVYMFASISPLLQSLVEAQTITSMVYRIIDKV